MSPLYLHNNKLLLRNNSLAVNGNCCCGCTFIFSTTPQVEHFSNSPDMTDPSLPIGELGTHCTITPSGMNNRGKRANKFTNSNIQNALGELSQWLTSIGYTVVNHGCVCYYPGGYPETLNGLEGLDEFGNPNGDLLWWEYWPCKSGLIVTEENQNSFPDVPIGECAALRVLNEETQTYSSPCDTDPEACDECCYAFFEPYCSISASCCRNPNIESPIIYFTGTIPVDFDSTESVVYPPMGSEYSHETSTKPGSACNDSGVCVNTGNTSISEDFQISWTPLGEMFPDQYYLTAQAKVCRGGSCCIGPSGAEELNLEPGTCSYIFDNETECECRNVYKRLCLILHTRDVKGSINGYGGMTKVNGEIVFPRDPEDPENPWETFDDCANGGIYPEFIPANYGDPPDYYFVFNYDSVYQQWKPINDAELLPGWEKVGANYRYTGLNAPSPDTYFTTSGHTGTSSSRRWTWAGGSRGGATGYGNNGWNITIPAFNLETSESAQGDAFYCKWKSKEWYWELRWVDLADKDTCGPQPDDTEHNAIGGYGSFANLGEVYCGFGSSECPALSTLEEQAGGSPWSEIMPKNGEKTSSDTNGLEPECGPQWGVWVNAYCDVIDCGQQLP